MALAYLNFSGTPIQNSAGLTFLCCSFSKSEFESSTTSNCRNASCSDGSSLLPSVVHRPSGLTAKGCRIRISLDSLKLSKRSLKRSISHVTRASPAQPARGSFRSAAVRKAPRSLMRCSLRSGRFEAERFHGLLQVSDGLISPPAAPFANWSWSSWDVTSQRKCTENAQLSERCCHSKSQERLVPSVRLQRRIAYFVLQSAQSLRYPALVCPTRLVVRQQAIVRRWQFLPYGPEKFVLQTSSRE